jgi:hypothetical protein
MNKTKHINVITNAIEDSYKSKLDDLMSRDALNSKELAELEEISNKVWKNYCNVEHLKFNYDGLEEGIEKQSLELLEHYANIKEKIGFFLCKIKPKSEIHYYQLKGAIAEHYIIALQNLFDVFQKKKIKSNLEREVFKRVVCETESPYYRIKKLLLDVKVMYDEMTVYYFSKNDYRNAHNYYFLLGEVLIKEIHYASIIKDDVLYDTRDIGILYYVAGQAFLRCRNIIKGKYLIVHYAPPTAPYLHSNISHIFNTGNISQTPEKLAIMCFERAKDILRKSGDRTYYLECRDILYRLKAKNKDYEFNISRIFVEICKNFVKNTNIITNNINEPNKIKEADVRDYFMSHINLMIEDIAVAENTKTIGYSDLTIFGKDNLESIQEAITEFKVWGRNTANKRHSYKNVLNQLRGYMSDFESFGIVVMINPLKSSIKEKYIGEIIKKDKLYVEDSIEEPFSESAFINLKSKHIAKTDEDETINVYHLILNIANLFKINN